jgi:FkbM family methyltransferase
MMMKIIILLIKNPKSFAKKIFGGIPRLFKIYISKDEFTINVRHWKKKNGDKVHRLNYPSLSKDSIVFDIGGYVGDFAHEIHKKYGCKVYIFEPHPVFYEKCVQRFKGNTNMITLNYGLSDMTGKFELTDSVDGSSFLNLKGKNTVLCEVKNIFDVLKDLEINNIDLMKINIEGGEYPLLQHIADNDKLNIVNFYQIQFHNFIEDAEKKRKKILMALNKSHISSWCFKFVWEGWERK